MQRILGPTNALGADGACYFKIPVAGRYVHGCAGLKFFFDRDYFSKDQGFYNGRYE
jgi:hypothetical protein